MEGAGRELLHEVPWPQGGTACLALQARDRDFRFLAGPTPERTQPFGPVADARNRSFEASKGFTGGYVGVYASANGQASAAVADVLHFGYRAIPQTDE